MSKKWIFKWSQFTDTDPSWLFVSALMKVLPDSKYGQAPQAPKPLVVCYFFWIYISSPFYFFFFNKIWGITMLHYIWGEN